LIMFLWMNLRYLFTIIEVMSSFCKVGLNHFAINFVVMLVNSRVF
jgi:hypothetical protein